MADRERDARHGLELAVLQNGECDLTGDDVVREHRREQVVVLDGVQDVGRDLGECRIGRREHGERSAAERLDQAGVHDVAGELGEHGRLEGGADDVVLLVRHQRGGGGHRGLGRGRGGSDVGRIVGARGADQGEDSGQRDRGGSPSLT
jgi:hypothetical protein